jgi:hypothetical protein
MKMSSKVDLRTLDGYPVSFVKQALEYWEQGDVLKIMVLMPNERCLAFVMDNWRLLKEMGNYEEALLDAYISTRSNWSWWSLDSIRFLFDQADPGKLRAAGDPIPNQDFFVLYRGVAGKSRARRVNGYSWTSSPNHAAWFAERFPYLGDPTVFTVTVPNERILARRNERDEDEYLLKLPLPVKPKRLKQMPKATDRERQFEKLMKEVMARGNQKTRQLMAD